MKRKIWMFALVTGAFFMNATCFSKEIKTAVVDGIEWSYEGDASGVEIKGWTPADASVKKDSVSRLTVPSKLLQGIVYGIDDDAFANCSGLHSVTLPNSIARIDSRAFMGCLQLRKINIPSKVEKIDYSAFGDCPSLGDGVVVIDGWVIALNGDCPEHLTIPDGVRGIAACVFQGQSSLRSVKIPDSVQYICASAFSGCTGLGDGLVIADGWVLGYNGNVPENLAIPKGVKAIAGGKDMWTNLKTLTIPEGVVSIGHESFQYCETLESVSFPYGLQRVFCEAFEYCNLKDIVLPANAMTIYPEAFSGNEELQSVKFSGEPPTASYGNSLRGVFRRYRTRHEVLGYYPKSSMSWKKFLSTEDCQAWGFTMIPHDDGGSSGSDQDTTFVQTKMFNGFVNDAAGVMCGIVQIATAKATKKGVKVSGFVMFEDGKKQTLKAATVPIENGQLNVTTKVGKTELALTITGDGFAGTLGEMTIESGEVGEDTGIISGTLKMSYFDAKTGKVKTKSIKLAGVASEGEAVGDLTVKGQANQSFEAKIVEE